MQDGGVEDGVLTLSLRTQKPQPAAEQPSRGRCCYPPKTMPHVQGQMGSHNETVGITVKGC